MDAGRCFDKQLVQLGGNGSFLTRQEPSGPESGDLAAKLGMRHIDFRHDRRGLTMEPQYFNFAVHTFGNRDDCFIDGLSRDRQFFLETSEEVEKHRGRNAVSDKSYYVNW